MAHLAVNLSKVSKVSNVISVDVPLGDGRNYQVHIGYGIRHELAQIVTECAPKAKRVALVTQQPIIDALTDASGLFVASGREEQTFLIGDGEHHKRLGTVEDLCQRWAEWGMTRNDVVVAVGGGIVTDVAGFAAACFHRGIRVIYVSTTLLGMIDAAVGGKTGVNLDAGKNLVGAFWQPSAVVCDVDTLASMPPRELACGLGEMAKYHFLGAPHLDQLPLEERIATCVRLKAAVVAADERETGLRATLNYGHTLAHALETAGGHDLRHGEAVAIGLVFAAELAFVLGRIDRDRVDEHRRIVHGYDLRTELPPNHDREQLVKLMGRDKKALEGLTFVLDGPAGVEQVVGVQRDQIDAAFDAMLMMSNPKESQP
jgi:5-deoxy-5-amino-3-dehydroquinate synthase